MIYGERLEELTRDELLALAAIGFRAYKGESAQRREEIDRLFEVTSIRPA